MKLLFIIFLNFSATYSFAQEKDTLYVRFSTTELMEPCTIKQEYQEDFPLVGNSCYYVLSKMSGNFKKEILFVFFPKVPPWVEPLKYEKLPNHQIAHLPFKDSKWFEETEYYDILKEFAGREKVIWLYDERFVGADSSYLVKVTFSFPTEE